MTEAWMQAADDRRRAQALIDLRRFEEALRVLGSALARSPEDTSLLCLTALALYRLHRNQEALAAAERALATNPQSEWALRLRALALAADAKTARSRRQRERRARAAVEAAAEAVRLAPNEYRTYVVVAESQVQAGDLRAADAAARRAIELAPESVDVWVTRSHVALKAQDFAAAEQAARRALSLDPASSAAHNNLGAALLGQRRGTEASAAFVEAGRLEPTSPVVRRNVVLAGLRLPRLLLAVVLLPLLAIPGVGMTVYLATAIAAPLLLRRVPAVERYAFRRGIRRGAAAGRKRGPRPFDAGPLQPLRPHYVRTSIVIVAALLAWGLTAMAGTALIWPQEGVTRLSLLPVVLGLGAFAGWLTRVLIRRTRRAS